MIIPKNKVLIDVLLPTFNGQQFLKEQINSILCQKGVEVRLYIQDDCSQDDTIKILSEFKEDPRVKVQRNTNNIGLRKNLNLLAKRSKAEFVALADQDDTWHPYKLKKLLNEMQKSSSILVFSDLALTDQNGVVTHGSKFRYTNTPGSAAKTFESSLIKSPYTGCTFLLQRKLLNLVFPLPAKIAIHDKWIGCAASSIGGVSFIDEGLTYYRQHNANVTGSFSFGLIGFLHRLKKQSNYDLRAYLRYRATHRAAICDYLLKLSDSIQTTLPARKSAKLFKAVYSSETISLSEYFKYLRTVAACKDEIGWKNLIVEIMLTTMYRSLR